MALKIIQDEVVISGMSGRFPNCDSIAEFREKLIKGEDMISHEDIPLISGVPKLPSRIGKLKDISRFDASFFNISPTQANFMDPTIRMLLEVTYEAIVDAGVNPISLRGCKVGVFVGVIMTEATEAYARDSENLNGLILIGSLKSFLANRVSYTFDFKGPSFTTDSACSSSMVALEQALLAMRVGLCDSAIVAGVNTCIDPRTTSMYASLNILSMDGKCKSFDKSANGCCRSEAVTAIFLQKKSVAKRNYATIVHCKSNCDGYKNKGITVPLIDGQKSLLCEIYAEAGINPADVFYIEAHGTGTTVGDFNELSAIAEVFCENRKEPLLVGSVKSNIGHTESAAGLCGIIKVLIAMEDGIIPANLHYRNPILGIPLLENGKIQIVDKRIPFKEGIAGVASFGIGGSNAHVILKSNSNVKMISNSSETKLFIYSGRTLDAVETVLDYMEAHKNNSELYGLLAESAFSLSAMPYRGYTIINSQEKISEIEKIPTEEKPVWFVFPGLGGQWPKQGQKLMELDIFRESIMQSHNILLPYGVDLYDTLVNTDDEIFDDFIKSAVSIVSVQIALIDCLHRMEIIPDGIIGHSLGEIACGYADGCLTAEETILTAYLRARCIVDANIPKGKMAATGLTWEQALHQCPEGVVPACHNAKNSVTISGLYDNVSNFMEQLEDQGVFVRNVSSCDMAMHSYLLKKVCPKYSIALTHIIKSPKPRSSKWISTSIPKSQWNSDLSKVSSADYYVNSMIQPVLFYEGLQHVPKDAIIIEIGPHCLLQSPLKQTLGAECIYLSTMKKYHSNSIEYFLSNIGKLYMAGKNPKVSTLFSPVKFPVSKGTPMIASIIRWEHNTKWNTPKPIDFLSKHDNVADIVFKIDITPNSPYYYLKGQSVNGNIVFPLAGYINLAWQSLAKLRNIAYDKMSVHIEKIEVLQTTVLSEKEATIFKVRILTNSGKFEIVQGENLIVRGTILMNVKSNENITTSLMKKNSSLNGHELNSDDFYKELSLRGYDLHKEFRCVIKVSHCGERAYIKWKNNWTLFLDNLIQLLMLRYSTRNMILPVKIAFLKIDPVIHQSKMENLNNHPTVEVIINHKLQICMAGGVFFQYLEGNVIPKEQLYYAPPVLEEVHFTLYFEKQTFCKSLEKENELKMYTDVCHYLAVSYLNKINFTVPCKDKINKILETSNSMGVNTEMVLHFSSQPNCILIKHLKTAFDNSFQSYNEIPVDLANDILFSNLLKEYSLKSCLDIVMENISERKLNILELSSSTSRIYPFVCSYMSNQIFIRREYILADVPSTNEEQKLKQYDIKHIPWNDNNLSNNSINNYSLVIAVRVLSSQDYSLTLKNINRIVKEDGFLLILESTTNLCISYALNPQGNYWDNMTWTKHLNAAGFQIIAQKQDDLMSTLFLCKKITPQKLHPVFIEISSLSYDWVKKLQEQFIFVENSLSDNKNHQKKKDLKQFRVWLTSNEVTSGIIGLVKCLRKESYGKYIRCLFNPSKSEFSESEINAIIQKDLLMNIYKNGWGSYRDFSLLPNIYINTQFASLNVINKGDLSSIKWVESPLKCWSNSESEDDVYTVSYASLNFKDVMIATGKHMSSTFPEITKFDTDIGYEFSGFDRKGHRVMGVVPGNGLATVVKTGNMFVWEVPQHWSLKEAATVPLIYSTVYYALIIRGRLEKGEKILIHSGSGGVGQAAIIVALSMGCEVFTTIGSEEKKKYLQTQFPQLQNKHFSNSRTTEFEFDILRATNGEGVDVVLNSLADDKLQASIRVLAINGRFLEIGKYDLKQDSPLGLSAFLKNISFHGVVLENFMSLNNETWSQIHKLVENGIEQGIVKPLKANVFMSNQVEEAFRFMAQGKHIGKVVINIQNSENNLKPIQVQAIPKFLCSNTKSYIITGGLGGFGFELANWLIEKGARKIILTSRSGIKSEYQHYHINIWKSKGVQILITHHDVSSEKETRELIVEAMTLGIVGGIFSLAMVLRSGMFANQNEANFKAVCNPKEKGTKNLDKISRQLCPELDYFVAFSSFLSGHGLAGESNYGFANSALERLCEERKKDGLPGLAIIWGPVGDAGVIFDKNHDNTVEFSGALLQRINSCLLVLDKFLTQPHPVVSSYVLAKNVCLSDSNSDKENLTFTIAHILGIKDINKINPNNALEQLGLDSLMSVELKQIMERDFDIYLSLTQLLKQTINNLKTLISTNERGNASESTKSNPIPDLNTILLKKDLIPLNKSSLGTPLFIVLPIDKIAPDLEYLASKIKVPVYGLYINVNVSELNIKSMASYFIQHVKAITQNSEINLVGYSLGNSVAFEIACNYDNVCSNLICVNGSPVHSNSLINTVKTKLQCNDLSSIETEALSSFATQFSSIDHHKLQDELLMQHSWKNRLNVVVDKLLDDIPSVSRTDLEMAATTYLKWILAVSEYMPAQKYSGNIILIRSNSEDTKDLELRNICKGEVICHNIEEDQERNLLRNNTEKIADIINTLVGGQ